MPSLKTRKPLELVREPLPGWDTSSESLKETRKRSNVSPTTDTQGSVAPNLGRTSYRHSVNSAQSLMRSNAEKLQRLTNECKFNSNNR